MHYHYFTGKKIAIYGQLKYYTHEQVRIAIEKMGGAVVPPDEAESFFLGANSSICDYTFLCWEQKGKMIIMEAKIDDYCLEITDVDGFSSLIPR